MHSTTDRPGFIVLPFADSGGKTTIPVTTATPGRASLTEGFPALNRTPIASGGIPPDGTDMNGILFEVSAWARWSSAGAPVTFDSAFSTAIGGYPRCSVLTNDALNGQWFSLVNNNTTDPDTTGTGWMNLIPVPVAITATGTLTIRQQGIVSVDATAGNITLTLPGASSALAIPIRYDFVRQDATANTVTIVRAGANTIETVTNIPLDVGQRITLVSDGGNIWRVTSLRGAGGMQTFVANGTFTVPSGVSKIRVAVTGGGGGGAGSGGSDGGSGGGAGGSAIGIYTVFPGATHAVTVGTSGTPGAVSGDGGYGGVSSFGSFLSATGGQPGTTTGALGGGGVGSGGFMNIEGGDGAHGSAAVSAIYGGSGGGSLWGGGGRAGNGAAGGGLAGRAYGAGGGGCFGAAGTGGAGAQGVVVVEWE